MPWALRRFQQSRQLHFVTFSCYRRQPWLDVPARRLFERALERARIKYGFVVVGYVVMPEHVHLLVGEPERATLATALQAAKQSVARRRAGASGNSGTTTSTSGASASASRSCATSTATRCGAGW